MLGDVDKRRKISEGTYRAIKETNPGLRITSEIYIQILEDALTTINSIIQYLEYGP